MHISKGFFASNKLLILSLILVFLSACSTDPVIYENKKNDSRYYLFCNLSPITKTQEVLLGMSLPESYPIDVTDADISISSQSETALFTYTKNGIYKNLTNPLTIVAGETYSLLARFANGKKITGKTTVPDRPHILFPAFGDTLEYYALSFPDTLLYKRIYWTSGKGAHFYTVFLDCNGKMKANSFQLYNTSTFFPEYRWNEYPIHDNELIKATLYVLAHDSSQVLTLYQRFFKNYYSDLSGKELHTAINFNNDPFTPQKIQAQNVTSNMGVFSSMSVDSCMLYLRIHTE